MQSTSTASSRPTRRKFLRAFGKLAATVAIAGTWTRFCEPHWIEVVEHPLAIPNVPDALIGKRLIQMSDLHVGSTDRNYIANVFTRANALRPDLIALTGDFINRNSAHAIDDVGRLLKSIAQPSLGIFACLGNHDYGLRWRQTRVGDQVAKAIRSSGVTLLRNEMTDVAGMQLVGLDDFWSPNFDPMPVLRTVDPNRAAICLAHNPDTCDESIWHEFRGIILSGHTHGGQCKIPFLPPPMLPVRNRNYVAGFYEIDAMKRLYINRGVGHTMPVRFNCRPEMTVFTLAPA